MPRTGGPIPPPGGEERFFLMEAELPEEARPAFTGRLMSGNPDLDPFDTGRGVGLILRASPEEETGGQGGRTLKLMTEELMALRKPGVPLPRLRMAWLRHGPPESFLVGASPFLLGPLKVTPQGPDEDRQGADDACGGPGETDASREAVSGAVTADPKPLSEPGQDSGTEAEFPECPADGRDPAGREASVGGKAAGREAGADGLSGGPAPAPEGPPDATAVSPPPAPASSPPGGLPTGNPGSGPGRPPGSFRWSGGTEEPASLRLPGGMRFSPRRRTGMALAISLMADFLSPPPGAPDTRGLRTLVASEGPAVLPLAALKLGSGPVTFLCAGDEARISEMELSEMNGETGRIGTLHGPLPRSLRTGGPLPERSFGLVCSALAAPLLARHLSRLARLLSPQGRIVASGLGLGPQTEAVLKAASRAGLTLAFSVTWTDSAALCLDLPRPRHAISWDWKPGDWAAELTEDDLAALEELENADGTTDPGAFALPGLPEATGPEPGSGSEDGTYLAEGSGPEYGDDPGEGAEPVTGTGPDTEPEAEACGARVLSAACPFGSAAEAPDHSREGAVPPVRRRGRPPKSRPEGDGRDRAGQDGTAVGKDASASPEEDAERPVRRRGRPPKAAPAEDWSGTDESGCPDAAPGQPRAGTGRPRGRPRKSTTALPANAALSEPEQSPCFGAGNGDGSGNDDRPQDPSRKQACDEGRSGSPHPAPPAPERPVGTGEPADVLRNSGEGLGGESRPGDFGECLGAEDVPPGRLADTSGVRDDRADRNGDTADADQCRKSDEDGQPDLTRSRQEGP
jgi:hypothetical protein